MKEKELALLLGKNDYLVEVEDRRLHTQDGVIDLSELKKKKYMNRIKSSSGQEFTIVKPTLTDILSKKAKRLPQIVMPKDASLILAYTGIRPDSLILDAGSGSGFLALFLAHYCSKGKVVTYEKRKEFAKVARKNIELTGLKNIILKEKDILEGIDEKNVDLITFDMKNAEKVVKNAYFSLKVGGWLVVYSPYIEQVKEVVKEINELDFTEIKTIENVSREWQVNHHTLPMRSGIMHTGFLTFARKGK